MFFELIVRICDAIFLATLVSFLIFVVSEYFNHKRRYLSRERVKQKIYNFYCKSFPF